jgi:hypothetical protein
MRRKSPVRQSRPTPQSSKEAEKDSERYEAFREAIMSDIVTSRVFEERALKRLFREWINANPAEYQPVLLRVIADISCDLDIPQ